MTARCTKSQKGRNRAMGEWVLQGQPPSFVHFAPDLGLNSEIGFPGANLGFRIIYPTSGRLKAP